jgi:hypothetical protein
MLFVLIMEDLKRNIESNKSVLEMNLNKNPSLTYHKVNELAHFVGRRYNMEIKIHFPDSSQIHKIDSFGTENIGVTIDKSRKKFPIPREDIKKKAHELTCVREVSDAYMYEGKEGVRVILESGRLEIQPGAVHLWCKINSEIVTFVDWLLQYVYLVNRN